MRNTATPQHHPQTLPKKQLKARLTTNRQPLLLIQDLGRQLVHALRHLRQLLELIDDLRPQVSLLVGVAVLLRERSRPVTGRHDRI